MNTRAYWTVSGTKINDSADALIQASQAVTQGNALKKYENILNKHFKENIRTNLRRSGMDADNFDDVFYMKINNGNITFVNTDPLVTQRYEYGYYLGDNDTNEEYYEEYMIQTSPRYFIRPSIQSSINEVGQLIVKEINDEYMKKRHQTYGSEV